MKRIISLVMSVLMIATMFCGMAITSNALVDYVPADHSTNADGYIAKITPVVTDNGDGTYGVVWYMDDYSVYGWHRLDIIFTWDENVEGVVVNMDSGDAIVNVWDLSQAAADGDANFNGSTVYNGTARKQTDVGINATADQQIGIESPEAGLQMALSKSFLEDIIGLVAADYNYDDTYGFPVGRATLKLAEGATSGVVSASIGVANVAVDDSTGEYAYTKEAFNIVPATIGSTDTTPTLPAGITLNVEEEASIRNADPAGMRFYANVTADDFSVISEMGTVIVKEGCVPGSDTTLKIPARVDTYGNYLQEYTHNEDGVKVFEDGVIAEAGTVEYTGVLSNIKDTNLEQNFTAYAYVIVEGVTYYSEAYCTRNYNQVAEAAAADVTVG